MTTTVNLRKLLHRKQFEMCTPCIASPSSGSFIVSDKFNLLPNSIAYFVNGVSAIYRYDGDEDAWLQLPNSGLAGAFGAGANGELRALGAMGGVFTQTATAGGLNTITTNRTIVANLAGTRVRVVAGTGIGFDGTIASNTLGANSVLTVSPAGTTFDATTQFQVFSGSLWFFNPGTSSVGFGVYDRATNSWTARSVTNLPTSWGTDGQLTSTIGSAASFATGTATAGSASTLTNSGKAWATNMWANYQIRITGGTGKGQIRTIASNTGSVITVSSNWTVNPDATSIYSIEGNEDFMYLAGNGAVTLYRFQISTNTWSVLSPASARATAPGAGLTLSWIDSVPSWTLPTNETPRAITSGGALSAQNGRYMYSFRGGGSNALDIYDIAANTWISNISYGNQNETFNNGTSVCDLNGLIYIHKEGTGRIFKFNVDKNVMQALTTCLHPQNTTVTGQRMCILPYIDGGTEVDFLFFMLHSRSETLRMLLV